MAMPPHDAPEFGRRQTDRTMPISSWIKFQLRMIHIGYPKWEGLIILAIVVFSVVLALTFAAEPGSIRMALRDFIEGFF